MEHSCFDINDFIENPGDISFFTMMLCYIYDIMPKPKLAHERKEVNGKKKELAYS